MILPIVEKMRIKILPGGQDKHCFGFLEYDWRQLVSDKRVGKILAEDEFRAAYRVLERTCSVRTVLLSHFQFRFEAIFTEVSDRLGEIFIAITKLSQTVDSVSFSLSLSLSAHNFIVSRINSTKTNIKSINYGRNINL